HLGAWPGAEYWQVGAFAAFLRGGQQRSRVDLAIVGQIQRDMPGSAKRRALHQLPVQVACGNALLAAAERTAALAQHTTQLRATEWGGSSHEQRMERDR